MNKFLIITLYSIICLAFLFEKSHTLSCYSCSTEAGDPYCTEDNFDENLTTRVECAQADDVCVRAIQLNKGNVDGESTQGTTVFRSCGSSSKSENPQLTTLGFYPLHNVCIIYKVTEKLFANSTFQVCSCASELGNNKGEMKC
jgi:hypothetical protein